MTDSDRPAHVTDAEIAQAMAVDALPDETRAGARADETDAVLTSAGDLASVDGDHLVGRDAEDETAAP